MRRISNDETHTGRLLRVRVRVWLSPWRHRSLRLIAIRRHVPILSRRGILLFRLPTQLGLMPCIVVLFRQKSIVFPYRIHQLFLHFRQHFFKSRMSISHEKKPIDRLG